MRGLLHAFWREVDAPALFADFGFAPRAALMSELRQRLVQRVLPGTPATRDLAALFPLLFEPQDLDWLGRMDAALLARLAALLAPAAPAAALAAEQAAPTAHWRIAMAEALTVLVSEIRAGGFAPAMRQRMSADLLDGDPFRQLAQVGDRFGDAVLAGDADAALAQAPYLRALLDRCRAAAASIHDHLAEAGVSVDLVFRMDQLRARCDRVELLMDALLAPDPAPELLRLTRSLVQDAAERRGVRSLMARHYSLLARKVAERSAETGEGYITRTRAEYRRMLARAAGGGTVLAGTTFLKFAIGGLGLSAFWGGWWAGVNYAASFVLIHLLHFTVATKQPAMTAPAMAARLGEVQKAAATAGEGDDERAADGFVDEIANLIRSQTAGILGNLALVAPVVLAVQAASRAALGEPLVGGATAEHILHDLTALGPTPLFAAFTGVLLFSASLVAGWVENWFVFYRLDSAIAWHPRIVQRLGAARAQRWAAWARANVSGLAANVSLGLMLGLVPAIASFFGLPIQVRHVTLSTGQLAAALGAEGIGLLLDASFWWCALGIVLTGLLNVGVSFALAFKVALRSRGIRVGERLRLNAALRRRLWRRPWSFLWPPKDPAPPGG
ncbi:site-specific recombinase [Aquabacterium sp. J223]|uniref:site-specific recombinase n=1 Tax=Aquabacterium sp. J223 TaxID=2898431 RepID=UPI0021AD62FB|nr:site-specific recombinase [Aquabacterium sp. J223]UUX96347.1 site-specific recombinase [Aquabacterium sp. J223]